MPIYGVRRRVACYVTRTTEQGEQLLVFDHQDDDPDDPSRHPGACGEMLPFEGIEDAASREVDEETGLIGLTFVRQLGGVELGLDDPGGPSMTTYVHLIAPTDDRTDMGPRRRRRWRRRRYDVRVPMGAAASWLRTRRRSGRVPRPVTDGLIRSGLGGFARSAGRRFAPAGLLCVADQPVRTT